MIRTALFLFLGLLVCNCMSQKNSEKNQKSENTESSKIQGLIKEKRFGLLQQVDTIVRLSIVKTLIEGTTDEYYNKLTVMDTLDAAATKLFVNKLMDDSTYNWNTEINADVFDPHQQYLLKARDGQLTVLLDTDAQIVGFIDLLGQELVTIKDNMIFN